MYNQGQFDFSETRLEIIKAIFSEAGSFSIVFTINMVCYYMPDWADKNNVRAVIW